MLRTTAKNYRNVDFHTHVDNHSQLLIVLQVNQFNKIYKFGAYISTKYEKNSSILLVVFVIFVDYKNYIRDDYAFIFTLDTNDNVRSTKFVIKDPKKAVRYDEKLGIRIGEGTDIGIEERFYENRFYYNDYMYSDTAGPQQESPETVFVYNEGADDTTVKERSSTTQENSSMREEASYQTRYSELLTSTQYGSVWSKFGDGSYDFSTCDSYNCKLFGNKKETSRYISSRFAALEVFTFEPQA